MTDTSDADDVDAIRERKLEEIERKATSPDEPLPVRGTAHFEELVSEHSPLLVDFYADWCGPCQMLEPVVENVAAETPATVAKVDVDAHQELASRYGVQGVPTMFLFTDGEPVERLVGVQDEATITGLVGSYT